MDSLIVPIYRNEKNIPDLLAAVESIGRSVGGEFEAVFVIDGSPDDSGPLLQRMLPLQTFRSRLIFHSRNFGSFAAVRTGMAHAAGTNFAVMAADLQEPPELIERFFRELRCGDVDVVIGTRETRSDPIRSQWSAQLFWSLYRRFVVPDIPRGGADVFGCNRSFRDCLLSCEESNSSLVALIFWLGFRRRHVSYVRRARVHGVSAWTLRKKVRYMMDSVFSFTDLPIRLLLLLGSVGTILSLTFGLAVLAARISGLIDVPGYAATALIVLFFGGLNTLGVGLVGSYAWRTYENTKRRPLAIVMREQEFGAAPRIDPGTTGDR